MAGFSNTGLVVTDYFDAMFVVTDLAWRSSSHSQVCGGKNRKAEYRMLRYLKRLGDTASRRLPRHRKARLDQFLRHVDLKFIAAAAALAIMVLMVIRLY